MAVLNVHSVTLEVPDIAAGLKFYTDAGLAARVDGATAYLACVGQDRPSIVLKGGFARKRLHHVSLRAADLNGIAARVPGAGGRVVDAPPGFSEAGLWAEDPHGTLYHLSEHPADPEPAVGEPFAINGPSRIVRIGKSAILPGRSYAPVRPLKLGHVLLFSPDVPASVHFVVEGLGMGLADRSEDVIAFCCARSQSDHHVLAFAKSPGVGFHHASFQVQDPDAVGRGGRSLIARSGRGDWGFGRHTIGSNFFHYIQDPWGSWFEYYSDMDYIDDYALWQPTNYDLADSLASWGPEVPSDFVHNYEVDAPGASAPALFTEA